MDQRLIGDGFRKRCANELECRNRVLIAQGETPPLAAPASSRPKATAAKRETSSRAQGQTVHAAPPVTSAPPAPTPQPDAPKQGTVAEAMLAVLKATSTPVEKPLVIFSDDLKLPIEALQGRFVLLGKSGSGKSVGSAVIAEACFANNVPVCVLDLLGNQWGLRANGLGDALPLPIIGGEHGDLALDIDDAELLARIFADGVSMILDLSLLSLEDQQWFGAAFFAELSRVLRRPAHVIIEEAEVLAPAFSRSKAHFATQGATTFWARKIRNFGVGWTFSTQRIALLHSDIIDTANVFIPMQSTGDAAQKALGKEAKSRVGKVIAEAIFGELGQLRAGEAWLLPGPEWLGEGTTSAPVRFRFRFRQTYHSTRVPKIGEPLPTPPPLVPVDLTSFAMLRRDELANKKAARGNNAAA